MKTSPKVLAAILAMMMALTVTGCSDDKKPEPRKDPAQTKTQSTTQTATTSSYNPPSPKDTKGKMPDIKYTLTKLTGYSQKTEDSFGYAGAATSLYKGNIIIGDREAKALQAIKVSGNTAAVDTDMFDNGLLKTGMGELRHPVVAGNMLYAGGPFSLFRYDGTTLTDMFPKEVKKPSPCPNYLVPSPDGTHAAIFNQSNNCRLNKAVLSGGMIKEVTPWFMTLAKNLNETTANSPFFQLGNVVFDGDLIYVMGSLTQKAAEEMKGRQTSHVVIAYTADGKQKAVYGNPDWMAGDGIKKGTENFFVTQDYVVVIDTQTGRGLSLYNKADGKYLGTYFSETVLGDKRGKIVGVAKSSDKEWYLVYNIYDTPQEQKLKNTRYIARFTLQ